MVRILGIGFHIYGLLIGLGIWTAYEVSLWTAEKIDLKREMVARGVWWAVIPGIIGARLYHVVDLWEVYGQDWVRMLAIWEGGLGIWGGLIGGLVGLIAYFKIQVTNTKSQKISLLSLLDIAVVGLPLAQAIGRWGNFFNGELYGRATSLPWGIVVPEVEGRVEPLFLYESLLDLVLFGGLVWVVKTERYKSGRLVGLYLIGYGVIRFLLETMRPEEVVWRIGGVAVAQIVAVAAILGGRSFLRKG